ncbi:MAG: TPR end-of-group domain-containing protein [Planctomycetota bacterium]
MRTIRFHTTTLLCGALLASPAIGAELQEPAPLPTLQEASAHLQTASWAEAIHDLERITEAQPKNGQAHFLLAFAVHGSGDLERAVHLHRKATEFPNVATLAWYNLGCAESLRGNLEESYQALDQAYALGYVNQAQLLADTDLANLRADEGFQAWLSGKTGSKTPSPASAPLHYPEERRQFDFTIGDWEIHSGGQIIGRSSYEFDLNGQTILIRNQGVSLATLTYVEKEKVWRQTWMSTNGHHDILQGGVEDGTLTMHQPLLRDQPGSIGRVQYRDIQADRFTLIWDVSADEGKTWTTQWQGTLKRTSSPEPEARYSLAGMAQDAGAETKQYAFKLGRWDIKARALTPNGVVVQGVGSSTVYFAEDGKTILDDIAVAFNGGGGFTGTTERTWSKEDGLWNCRWVPANGAATEFTATYDEELKRVVETFRGQDQNGAFTGKLSFYDVTANSIHVRLDHHYDQGPVVKGVWEYLARKTP